MGNLSDLMEKALNNMLLYGEYEMWELPHWNFWNATAGCTYPSIRTNTMNGLEKRGLVKKSYNPNRDRHWKWSAVITDKGKDFIQDRTVAK